jgi:hypothetical protein
MAVITSNATLETAVGDYLARDDLSTFIPNFVQNAENKLFRTLHLRVEETALSVTVANGTGRVPTGFKKLKLAYVPDSPIRLLEWAPLEDLYRQYPTRSGANTPCRISRQGDEFVFGPYAKDFTLTGTYYKKQNASRTAIAVDATGDPDGSTGLITGLADTSDFNVGDRVTVSDGFPSTTDGYKVTALAATTMTLDTLSTSSATDVTITQLANSYITDAPEVLLYGALLEAEPFIMNDERLPVWRSLFEDAVGTLDVEEVDADTADGSLQIRSINAA